MSYLLTHLGTFVCYDLRLHRLVHVAWGHIAETTVLVEATLERDLDGKVVGARLDVAEPDPILGPGGALRQSVAAEPAGASPTGRVVVLCADGGYLCAEPYHAVTATRERASVWEQFLVIEPDEVADLMVLLANRWVLHRTGAVIEPAEIRIEERFRLRFGPLMLALPDILPLTHARRFAEPDHAEFHQADLFVDGWKVERVSLFRPLVFYAVFGSDTLLQQLGLSLASLAAFGGYRDNVLVFTDRDAAAIAPYVPAALQGKVRVTTLLVGRPLDYKLARYQITRSRLAATCQPLLYLDADVLFDDAVQPMLAELARGEGLNAPLETTRITDSQSLGAELVAADGVGTGDRCGFNAGTIGFSNITIAGGQLRLMEDALVRHAGAPGQASVWQDQPMANYVAVKTDGMGTALLSRYVRFDHPHYLDTADLTPEGRCGLVHFWNGVNQEAKRDAMQAYLLALRGLDGRAAATPVRADPVALVSTERSLA
ncbi:MAG: hypothetical protein P4L71_18540 [Acetobacteraceae bacterium]|nr:hypothetical protein [Acetobacteraceae bacterium]